ncbi:Retrovirus-related Pol polyprotein from transposon opus, partial [Mucuna pruriens]
MEEEARPIRRQQRRMNSTILDVVKKEVTKLFAIGNIYPILDSQWVSLMQVVPKKFGITVMKNQHDQLDCMEVFMDDIIVYADSFDACLENLSKVLTRCIDTNLVLNFEKCHFMVIEGIVLGLLVSNKGIEVDKSKIDIITSLSNPASVPEDVDFKFDQPCFEAFQELKNQLTSALILQASNWDYQFELLYDASNSALGVVLGQRVGVDKQIRDKKGVENSLANHLSRIGRASDLMPIREEFHDDFHQRHVDCKKRDLKVMPSITYGMIHTFGDSAMIKSSACASRTPRSKSVLQFCHAASEGGHYGFTQMA